MTLSIYLSNFIAKRLIFFYLIDDKCQFWLNESSRVLTSPHAYTNVYYHNLNCTWMIKSEQGSYINFQIENFEVNKQ